jgi:hypothetical protein
LTITFDSRGVSATDIASSSLYQRFW